MKQSEEILWKCKDCIDTTCISPWIDQPMAGQEVQRSSFNSHSYIGAKPVLQSSTLQEIVSDRENSQENAPVSMTMIYSDNNHPHLHNQQICSEVHEYAHK
jgi:hypothetical protein